LGVPPHNKFQAQIMFSPDGTKMAYRHHTGTWGNVMNEIRLFDFNRCTGNFTNPTIISWQHSQPGLGLSFSSNSKYIYASTFDRIYQINSDTTDVQASLQLVAVNDGYYSPQPPFQSDFWTMYLAADGKVYLSSGSSVVDMHFINSPDTSGVNCDVQQHALPLPCWSWRSHVNHPNYYLGCDTTLGCPCLVLTNINEASHDFKFNIYPNPSSGSFKTTYMLPQNKEGRLEINDVTGKILYQMPLPQWSTLQQINLPSHISNGIYNCVIRSYNSLATKKFVLLRD
ncbi:MAG: T9SS type A sorting domain-containing protein, partial [Bacteroidia bacterium]